MSGDGALAFSEGLNESLRHQKYTRWAADLTEDQAFVLLWAVGEFGGRAYLENIEARSGPGPSESTVEVRLSGTMAAARAAAGLRILARYGCYRRPTLDELHATIRAAVAGTES